MTRRGVWVATLVVLLTGCLGPRVLEDRTTQGPTAEELWLYQMLTVNGREPTFEERQHWRDHVDDRIARFLREHPEAANSLDIAAFRFERRVVVGMSKEQVLLLLGRPLATSRDPRELEARAGRHWPQVREQAVEAWAYPLGWTFYFADDRVVDITRSLRR